MNLETTYLGLSLPHPIVASASPLSHDIDGIRRLEDAGASAIVLQSLFEEQLIEESRLLDHNLDYGSESYGESLSYVPDLSDYNSGPDGYLELIREAKEKVTTPIIGSLNGVTPGGWKDYAAQIEEAGADALELNLYFVPSDIDVSAQEMEAQYLDVVREVRKNTKLPLAVKLCPYFSSLPHLAKSISEVGADALVLFNRFYQPDIDLETISVIQTSSAFP